MRDEMFILAFDHRGSFKTKMFGISGREETSEETAALQAAKRLVYEGPSAYSSLAADKNGTIFLLFENGKIQI